MELDHFSLEQAPADSELNKKDTIAQRFASGSCHKKR
jgi:hypothetical protein